MIRIYCVQRYKKSGILSRFSKDIPQNFSEKWKKIDLLFLFRGDKSLSCAEILHYRVKRRGHERNSRYQHHHLVDPCEGCAEDDNAGRDHEDRYYIEEERKFDRLAP